MISVYMGGTCNGSKWRELFKSIEGYEWFDPVVEDWNEEAQAREIEHRRNDDILLFVVTPKVIGPQTIAEVVDDSNKRPEKVVFSYTDIDENSRFEPHYLKALECIRKMVEENGATYVPFSELRQWFLNKIE